MKLFEKLKNILRKNNKTSNNQDLLALEPKTIKIEAASSSDNYKNNKTIKSVAPARKSKNEEESVVCVNGLKNLDSLLKQQSLKETFNFEDSYKDFNPFDFTYQKINREIKAIEFNFFKYMHGMPILNPHIANKWFFEGKLDIKEELAIAISEGYLKVGCRPIDRMTVSELKTILKAFNIDVIGKKADLLQEALKLDEEKIEQIFLDKYYVATEKLKAIPNKNSVALDPDFEEQVISLLLKGEDELAYKAITKFRWESRPSLVNSELSDSTPIYNYENDKLLENLSYLEHFCKSKLMVSIVKYAYWMGYGFSASTINKIAKIYDIDADKLSVAMYIAVEGRKPVAISPEKLRISAIDTLAKRTSSLPLPTKENSFKIKVNSSDEIYETEELETKFINELKAQASEAGIKDEFSFVKVGKDIRVIYKDTQIGMIKLNGRVYSMQILTRDDVLNVKDESYDVYVSYICIWLVYILNLPKDLFDLVNN